MVLTSGVFPDKESGFSAGFSGQIHFPKAPSNVIQHPGSPLTFQASLKPLISEGSTVYNSMYSPVTIDRSLRNLKGNLEDSENRCCVLKYKLKEAQSTLDLQSDRLYKIEHSARENSLLVNDLKQRENEYRKRIDSLQLTEQEKDKLKEENMKIRQEMQDRVNKLDLALRTAQVQNQVAENDNQKRVLLLEQSSQALSMLEMENNSLKQDLGDMQKDLSIAKESVDLANSKIEPIDEENKELRKLNSQIREENEELSRKITELSGQLLELRRVTQSMKKENEKLATAWKSASEEKHRQKKQIKSFNSFI